MTPVEMEKRIVRYGDLIPCKTAFIDAHTPGSDQKENFTIIGVALAKARTSMSISTILRASTSVQQGNRRVAAILCTATPQLRCFLS